MFWVRIQIFLSLYLELGSVARIFPSHDFGLWGSDVRMMISCQMWQANSGPAGVSAPSWQNNGLAHHPEVQSQLHLQAVSELGMKMSNQEVWGFLIGSWREMIFSWRLRKWNISTQYGEVFLILIEKHKQISLSISTPTLKDNALFLLLSFFSFFIPLSKNPLYPLGLKQMVWFGKWSARLLARPDWVTPACQGFPHKTLATFCPPLSWIRQSRQGL